VDAFTIDIYKDDLGNYSDLNDVGIMMAMTGSAEVNDYSIKNLSKEFGENGSYRLTSVNELQNPELAGTKNLFSKRDDFINLLEVARDYPQITEVPIASIEELQEYMQIINDQDRTIPLFIKRADTGDFDIILSDYSDMIVNEGDQLVYMGKSLIIAEPQLT